MGWKKSTRLTVAAVGMFAVTLLAFQNCAPEQYFRAVELEDQSSSSPFPNPNPAPLGSRYFITVGELKGTDAARAALLTVSGRMMLVRDHLTGSTEAFVHAIGLPAVQPGTVHVHDLPCAVNAGGGHYKLDYAEAGTVASNEIWPIIPVTDAAGIGSGYARVNKHYARPEAQSMVVHDPVTPATRLGCGLLHSPWGSSIVGGSFQPLAAGSTALPNGRGSAAIARLGTDGLTVVRASISGFAPGTTYNAHVHNRPCASPDFGGAHYLQNPDVIETVATANNEIWMQFNTTAAVNGTGGGFASVRVQVPHVARADAVSIVIHDPVTPTTRLFCVDLTQPVGFIRTEAGLTRYPTLNGAAKMERLATGETKITVSNLVGLAPTSNYILHVHDRPCHINGGGGHYKHDYGIADVIESNEVWVRVTTDALGSASGATLSKNILRPEAYSVVLHDLDAGGTRLACADLYQ